jgi:hypothetical protein
MCRLLPSVRIDEKRDAGRLGWLPVVEDMVSFRLRISALTLPFFVCSFPRLKENIPDSTVPVRVGSAPVAEEVLDACDRVDSVEEVRSSLLAGEFRPEGRGSGDDRFGSSSAYVIQFSEMTESFGCGCRPSGMGILEGKWFFTSNASGRIIPVGGVGEIGLLPNGLGWVSTNGSDIGRIVGRVGSRLSRIGVGIIVIDPLTSGRSSRDRSISSIFLSDS